MDVNVRRSNELWQYDPSVDGFTSGSILFTAAGAPAISGGKLRLNAAEVVSLAAFRNSSLDMAINVPTAPTAGDARSFGLEMNGGANKCRMKFDISGTVFSASVYNANGTLIGTKTINWSSAWTATEAIYRISFSERNVFFTVNDVIVASFLDQQELLASVTLGKQPVSVFLKNENADNMDCGVLSVY